MSDTTELRLREVLGARAHNKSVEAAVLELVQEVTLLARWNEAQRQLLARSAANATPVELDDLWTSGT